MKVTTLDKFLKKCSTPEWRGGRKGIAVFLRKKGGSVLNVLARILFDLVSWQILVGVRVSDELPEAIKSELNSIKGLPTTSLKV